MRELHSPAPWANPRFPCQKLLAPEPRRVRSIYESTKQGSAESASELRQFEGKIWQRCSKQTARHRARSRKCEFLSSEMTDRSLTSSAPPVRQPVRRLLRRLHPLRESLRSRPADRPRGGSGS